MALGTSHRATEEEQQGRARGGPRPAPPPLVFGGLGGARRSSQTRGCVSGSGPPAAPKNVRIGPGAARNLPGPCPLPGHAHTTRCARTRGARRPRARKHTPTHACARAPRLLLPEERDATTGTPSPSPSLHPRRPQTPSPFPAPRLALRPLPHRGPSPLPLAQPFPFQLCCLKLFFPQLLPRAANEKQTGCSDRCCSQPTHLRAAQCRGSVVLPWASPLLGCRGHRCGHEGWFLASVLPMCHPPWHPRPAHVPPSVASPSCPSATTPGISILVHHNPRALHPAQLAPHPGLSILPMAAPSSSGPIPGHRGPHPGIIPGMLSSSCPPSTSAEHL